MAPDAFDVGSGEQPFHLILKFLSYQIVFQNRYDQDFPELWHGLVSKNPAVNNFCSGEQRGDRHCEDGECQKGEAYTDIATSWEKTDSREFRWVHWHVILVIPVYVCVSTAVEEAACEFLAGVRGWLTA